MASIRFITIGITVMIEKELSDIDLKLLVESAFQKLEKTEEIDSKISTVKI